MLISICIIFNMKNWKSKDFAEKIASRQNFISWQLQLQVVVYTLTDFISAWW